VDIREDHTLVRLPASLSLQMLSKLRRVRVRGKVLDISRVEGDERA
jgi:ATP-dependent RNA helicase DeaD